MTTIDLRDDAQMAKAVASGLIWSAPMAAIQAALTKIAAGELPPPTYVPAEYRRLAMQYGVTQAEEDIGQAGPA